MSLLNESTVELAAIEYLRQLGYSTAFGPDIAPDGVEPERTSYAQAYLTDRLHEAMLRINPGFAPSVVDDAIKRLFRAESQNPLTENSRVHKLLTEGVPVEHRSDDGSVRTTSIWLVDFDHPENNDWLAVNQFTIIENKNRRPDVLVFLNGIPVALFELKNLAN